MSIRRVLLFVGLVVMTPMGCVRDDDKDEEVSVDVEDTEWVCFLDQYCDFASVCVSGAPSRIMTANYYTVPNCHGGTCDGVLSDCANGSVCAFPDADPVTFFSYFRDNPPASCLPLAEVCGGSERLPCADGQYCELVGALCSSMGGGGSQCIERTACAYQGEGGFGTCRPKPSAEDCAEEAVLPVCGCDGTSFDNDCLRRAAGAVFAHEGVCGDE